MNLAQLGKLLILFGVTLVLSGLLIIAVQRAGLFRLPGDLSFNVGRVRVWLPLGTSILLSLVFTLLLNLWLRR